MHRCLPFPLVIALFVSLASVGAATAEIPSQVHYQGRVVVGGINFDGSGQFKFLLYQHTDSGEVAPGLVDLPLWSNASSAPAGLGEPATAVSLPVSHGLYSVGLGNTALPNMAALPASLLPEPPHDQVFLRVWFSNGGGFTQLAPDQPVRSVPFALHAGRAESVPDGSIGPLALAPGAVTAAKIEPGAVSQLGTPNGSIPNALQIDALGHAGIGTINPRAALHVTGGSDVTAPGVLSTVPGSPFIQGVAYNGRDLLAVARSDEGEVAFWDITDPAAPVARGSVRNEEASNGHYYDSIPRPVHLAFDPSGRILVIVSFDDTSFLPWITLLSVENAAEPNPTFQAFLEDDVDGFDDLDLITAIAVSETDSAILLAVASTGSTHDTLSIIDITEPSTPRLRTVLYDGADHFDKLASVENLAFEGPLLAVAAHIEHAVSLIDVTDPDAPELLSVLEQDVETAGHTYTGLLYPYDVELMGDLLAISTTKTSYGNPESLTLVDVRNPADPQHLSTLTYDPAGAPFLSGVQSIALGEGNLLALGATRFDPLGDGLVLFDISDPAIPVVLNEIHNGEGEFTRIEGTYLLFAGPLLLIGGRIDDTLTIADPLVQTTGAAGMVVDQRLGIGVQAPEAALHVRGDVRVDNASLFAVETPRISMGIGNAVNAQGGAAIGRSNAVEFGGYAIGNSNTASGGHSFAMGMNTRATGVESVAIGSYAWATGNYAMALGGGAWADGNNAVAMGLQAEAPGDQATALGGSAHAEGFGSVAVGDDAKARGDYAYALGQGAQASGNSATAMGRNTVAPSYVETALGAYNTVPATVFSENSWDSRDRLLVIGNGSSDLLRADLLTIYKDGRLTHAGSISTVGDVRTVGNFRYILPRARKYQVGAAAFVPWRSDTEYIRGDGYLQYPLGGSTTAATFKAPVHLPDGATITKLSVYYFDDWESYGGTGSSVFITHLQSNLRRMGNGAGDVASELVAATLTTGTEGFPLESAKHALETTRIDLPLVDNFNYQYWLEVAFHVNTPSANLRFYGATIEYTQDTVAP